MRRGYHMGIGFYGSYILILFLIAFAILIFILLKNKPSPNLFVINLLDILKEKYACGEITFDEFVERKSIIENTKYSNAYTAVLLEKYAKCEIKTKEFLEEIKKE